MTAANFPADLAAELGYEGGFVDNPADPGGATNLGVTQATLSHWLGRQASIDDVKALTAQTVAPLYRALYWNAIMGDALPSGVDLLVFDEAINSGPYRAAVTLQEAAHTVADGHIGPMTLTAVRGMPSAALIDAFTTAHEAFYRSLPTFATFGHGWLARLHAAAQRATAMATETSV